MAWDSVAWDNAASSYNGIGALRKVGEVVQLMTMFTVDDGQHASGSSQR